VGLGVRYKLAQVELKWELLHASCNVRPGLDVPRHRVAVQQGLSLFPCSSAHLRSSLSLKFPAAALTALVASVARVALVEGRSQLDPPKIRTGS
jgi:hypothetical protein